MKVLITDQFDTPNLEAREGGIPWDEAVEYFENIKRPVWHGKIPEVIEIEDESELKLEYATSAFIEDENGNLKLWKYRWDSSG